MVLLFLIPDLATWLPKKLFESKNVVAVEQVSHNTDRVEQKQYLDSFDNLLVPPNRNNIEIDQFEGLLIRTPAN
jgi:hypothetical protein